MCLNFSERKKLFVNTRSMQQCLIFYLILFLSPISFFFFLSSFCNLGEIEIYQALFIFLFLHFLLAIHHIICPFHFASNLNRKKSKYIYSVMNVRLFFHFSKTFQALRYDFNSRTCISRPLMKIVNSISTKFQQNLKNSYGF